MIRSLRYLLLLNVLPSMGVLAGFAVIVGGGYALTGGESGLFENYFETFPFMLIMILFLLSFNLSTSNLNIGLSFGARRRDYFLAIQGAILTYAAGAVLLQKAVGIIPALMGVNLAETMFGGQPLWAFLLVCVAVLSSGCMVGLLYARSRAWGMVVMVTFLFVGIVGVVAFLLVINDSSFGIWGDLPWILSLMTVGLVVVSEYVVYRAVTRAVVK